MARGSTMPVDSPGSPILTEALFEKISAMVKGMCGINLHTGKKELVKARLSKRLRALKLSSFEEYIELVEADSGGEELVTMIDALSTNMTSFFREAQHFEHLAQSVFPRLRARSEHDRKQIRIWSAGCSSGEEPYTLSILLNEEFPGLAAWDAKILATDISTQMLARGREGTYKPAQIANTAQMLVSKYFTSIGEGSESRYQVVDAVKRLVTFARLNLMGRWPMHGPFDVIFCRNVMIYFDKPTQEKLVERFWRLLASGGTLFIGHSESLAGVDHRFKYIQPTVYEKP